MEYFWNELMRIVGFAIALFLLGESIACSRQASTAIQLLELPPVEDDALQLASYLSKSRARLCVTPYGPSGRI